MQEGIQGNRVHPPLKIRLVYGKFVGTGFRTEGRCTLYQSVSQSPPPAQKFLCHNYVNSIYNIIT